MHHTGDLCDIPLQNVWQFVFVVAGNTLAKGTCTTAFTSKCCQDKRRGNVSKPASLGDSCATKQHIQRMTMRIMVEGGGGDDGHDYDNEDGDDDDDDDNDDDDDDDNGGDDVDYE